MAKITDKNPSRGFYEWAEINKTWCIKEMRKTKGTYVPYETAEEDRSGYFMKDDDVDDEDGDPCLFIGANRTAFGERGENFAFAAAFLDMLLQNSSKSLYFV